MDNADDLPVEIAEIERIGKMLIRLGEQYVSATQELRKLKKSQLSIAGLTTAGRGEKYLRGWLKTIREAVDDAAVAMGEKARDKGSVKKLLKNAKGKTTVQSNVHAKDGKEATTNS